MALSEYADMWDKEKKVSEKFLEDWVDENPQWWAVGIATFVQTSMDLGQGMVDVLRFGEGVAEGGWRGYGKDALRLLTIIGPLGRAGGMVSRFVHIRTMRLAVKTTGVTGPCTFTAANNAMSIVSGSPKNLFLTAKEAAKGLGKPLSSFAMDGSKYKMAAWIDDLVGFMQNNGAKVKLLNNVKCIDDAINAARTADGVVIFAVRYHRVGAAKPISHSIIAVRDAFGRVKFGDYGGKLVSSVKELITQKGPVIANEIKFVRQGSNGAGGALVEGLEFTGLLEKAMAVMKGGVFVIEGVTAIETTEDGLDLAIPVSVAAVPIQTKENDAPPEVVKESFNAYKARLLGTPVMRMPAVHITGKPVPSADYLTGVQYRLNAASFGAGPVDGILGPRTLKAIRKFQEAYREAHNLRVDAVPGPKTQAALVSVCGY